MEAFLLERSKNSNGIGVKNVLFAPGVEKSPSSSYLSSSDQLSGSLSHSNSVTPITSTSQLIKQTLSPLVHHRPTQALSNSLADGKVGASPLKMKPNSVSSIGNSTSSIGNYQLTSNNFIMTNNTGNGGKSNFTLSTSIDTTNTPVQKTTSSPSRSISSHTNTNTLPSHVGRSNNIQYQFESNYSIKNKPKSFTSPGNTTFFNALSSISASNAVTTANQTSTGVTNLASTSSIISNSNIYGTLPKTANSLVNSSATGGIYGNVSAVANEFEQLIARNATGNNSIGGMSTTTSNNHGNYNTLGSYRVQYSSTNPFLNHFNPSDTTTSSDYKMTDDK